MLVVNEIVAAVSAVFTALTAIFTWMAARQAQRSAEAAQHTLQVSTRPWIGVKLLERKGELGPKSPLFSLQLKNYGSLPAYLAKHCLNWSVKEPPDEPVFGPACNLDTLILNPGQEIAVLAPGPAMTNDDLVALKRGEALFVWFSITYRDALAREHRLMQLARSTDPSISGFTWIPKSNYWHSD